MNKLKYSEYDLFVPLYHNNGKRIHPKSIKQIKHRLVDFFGGITDFRHESEGIWKVGDVKFRDAIVIFRVIGPRSIHTRQFLRSLQAEMEETWDQIKVLIIERDVRLL